MEIHSSASIYGRILQASAMLVIVLLAVSAMIHYFSNEIVPDASANKPVAGMVTGVIYSPPNSSALVGDTVVREGDAINDIAVVAILNNAVEFSKSGRTWRQEVLEKPGRIWKK
jgi:hypothetical protein